MTAVTTPGVGDAGDLANRGIHQRAIFFDGALQALPPSPWDVAFRIASEEYEGDMRLQMHVQALRATVPIEC